MTPTKELTDVIKNAPVLPDTVGCNALFGSNDGYFGKIAANTLCQKSRSTIPANGGCLKITNFNTIAVAVRAGLAYGAALGFFSSYGAGQPLRTSHKILFAGRVSFYINGTSDNSATLYIKNSVEQSASVNIISFDTYYPTIESVASIPADAILLSTT